MSKLYDVIILGAGPGGLAAGLYSGRARLSTLIIEKGSDGGQIAITDEIENYPGQVLEEESCPSLIARMTKQCEHFGCERVSDTVVAVELKGDVNKVTCNNGTYEGKTVIIATGAYPRPIGCEGEKEYASKGVSYCATCDANFFEGFDVYVVGGGDSAVEEAMYLTKFARNVMGLSGENDRELAFAGIDALENYFKEIGIPMTLTELGIDDKHFEAMAEHANTDGYLKDAFVALTNEDIVEIYKTCL